MLLASPASWDSVSTLHMRGTVRMGDLKGTWESWLDLKHSLFRRQTEFSGGLLRTTECWNGKVSWTADQTGDVVIAESEEARADAIDSAFIETLGYRFPERFDTKPVPQRDGAIRFTPRGGDPVEVRTDPLTHRVVRVTEVTGAAPSDLTLSAYKDFEGIDLPTEIMEKDVVGTKAISVTSAEVDGEPPSGIFDPPAPSLTELEFPAGKDSVTVDFTFKGDEIYLPVSVDGAPPRQFLFDTGSTDTLSTAWAKKLGLKVDAAGSTYGGGPGSTAAGLTRISSLEVAGLTMRDQTIDTAKIPDRLAPGIIGYELIRRAVVSIDYPSRRMTFAKPASYRPPSGAVALPFRFASKSEILIEAELDGNRGEFEIDTGQDVPLTVNRPFAERTGLLTKYQSGRKSKEVGFGGKASMVTFRPSHFTFGGTESTPDQALLSLDRTGGNAEEHVAGQIGNGMLMWGRMTLDYANRMVYLERNIAAPPQFLFTAKGFGLTKVRCRRDAPCEVLEVDSGGPAARAGIRKGDVIVSRAAPSGTEFTLTLKRGSRTWTVTLKST